MDLCVHFIGIGGVSMSSLAKYLLNAGFTVQGSDITRSAYTDELIAAGAEIFIGNAAENIKNAQMVVYSDAIKAEDKELVAARQRGLYVISRTELLKSVAENFKTIVGVGGCHGKTTVTCMLAHIFRRAKLKFTAHIGGEDNEFSNCALFGGEIFLSEVCEYKKNLLAFDCTLAVCLNADPDHLDCYKDYDELKNTYYEYIKRADKAIINIDDGALAKCGDKNAATFGFSCGAKYTAKNLVDENGKYRFDFYADGKKACRVRLCVYGRHNVQNALAAAATATELGVKAADIKRGLADFKGVKRRFENIGEINGAKVIIDYAHHPREIAAVYAAAKELNANRIVTVFQPHTYSRTIFLKDEFLSVLGRIKNLYIYKTFAARENFTDGGSAFDLYRDLGGETAYFDDFAALKTQLEKTLLSGDLLLVLGAGDLAEKFRAELSH